MNKKLLVVMIIAIIFTFVSCTEEKTQENNSGDNQQITQQINQDQPSDIASEISPNNEDVTGNNEGDKEVDKAPSSITIEQARAIALAKVPGASPSNVTDLERETDNGRIEYEGSIVYGGFEYSFEIDGTTGNIIRWEIEESDE